MAKSVTHKLIGPSGCLNGTCPLLLPAPARSPCVGLISSSSAPKGVNHHSPAAASLGPAPALLEQLGIGPEVAAQVIVSWSHRGRIRSEAAFAKLGGMAPVEASSGMVTRHRLNRSGDRQLERLSPRSWLPSSYPLGSDGRRAVPSRSGGMSATGSDRTGTVRRTARALTPGRRARRSLARSDAHICDMSPLCTYPLGYQEI